MHARISVPGGKISCRPPPNSKRCQRTIVHSTEGVQDLISRDRRVVELTDAFEDQEPAAAAPAAPTEAPPSTSSSTSSSSSSSSSKRQAPSRGPRTRQQRQADMAKAADAPASSAGDAAARFRRCKEAIDAGLASFQQQDYQGAIQLFNTALELPGNGAYRLSGSPREYACPSDAEEHACLYNMACCYAQLGQKEAALTCLESILESGFKDIQTLQSDPDLRPVQGAALQAIINKYTGIGGLVSKLMSKKDKDEMLVSDDNKNKPWLLW